MGEEDGGEAAGGFLEDGEEEGGCRAGEGVANTHSCRGNGGLGMGYL